ncbi:uncharacterized protein LOC133870773 isoform X2 [Alnus glutinosa]|uniref:uncharacterized protein LOC133870773 isoform X2 n=1 Tax=Alnus glutinosa TaxID=3517 RepID=UPI002D77247F|nr:uncharacterized protein LOC133870773 isoform X2 [Alnus glutinosa]
MTCSAILNGIVTRTRIRDPDSLRTRNPHRSVPHFLHFDSSTRANVDGNCRLGPRKRRRCVPRIACSLQLPLLPFNINEVLVPSEKKTLHLYEARYLSLLDESLLRKKKLFVHFVLDPIAISESSGEASFAARYGCLVLIENVERLDVGALVSIRGIGRIKILKFVQADPFIIGEVIPMQDMMPDSLSKVSSKVMEVREAMYSLNSLEIKLKDADSLVTDAVSRIYNILLPMKHCCRLILQTLCCGLKGNHHLSVIKLSFHPQLSVYPLQRSNLLQDLLNQNC